MAAPDGIPDGGMIALHPVAPPMTNEERIAMLEIYLDRHQERIDEQERDLVRLRELDMDELRKKVATLESKVAVMEAALSPTHRRSVSWEPTIPPPGYVQREFGRFNVAIGRLQRHLGLDEESLEQAAKRRRST